MDSASSSAAPAPGPNSLPTRMVSRRRRRVNPGDHETVVVPSSPPPSPPSVPASQPREHTDTEPIPETAVVNIPDRQVEENPFDAAMMPASALPAAVASDAPTVADLAEQVSLDGFWGTIVV